ncbi:MAG: hypothetical protein V1734_03215 [Nanoarchaeota archaeon]
MVSKKKPEKRETPDDSIHVRLENPTAIRKDVLAVAIDIIGLLKRYYEYIEIKKQKDNIVRLLKADINEIRRLARELDVEEMPVTISQLMNAKAIEMPEKAEPKAKANVSQADDVKKEEIIKAAKSQLPPKVSKAVVRQQPKDKLEDELAELKSMISRL